MRVLLTGATGQVGQWLQQIKPPSIELIACDRQQLNITDASQWEKMIAQTQPVVIINAAAYTAVDQAEKETELVFAVNAEAVKYLAESAKKNNIRVIQISTDYVFNGESNQAYLPNTKTDPINQYGASKLRGEQYLQSILPDQHVIIRTAWVYSLFSHNFLKTMLRLLNEKEKLTVVADQIGTPTSAKTLAEIIWRVIDLPAIKGIYHFTDAGVASWYDFAVAIQEQALRLQLINTRKLILPVTSHSFPTLAKRPAFSLLDKQKTEQDLAVQLTHWQLTLADMLSGLSCGGEGRSDRKSTAL